VADIRQGVDSANVKLDILVGDSKDPREDLVASGYACDDGGWPRRSSRTTAARSGSSRRASARPTPTRSGRS
jgi:hypothetical protein